MSNNKQKTKARLKGFKYVIINFMVFGSLGNIKVRQDVLNSYLLTPLPKLW